MNVPLTQCWPTSFAERYRAKGYWTDETFRFLLSERAATPVSYTHLTLPTIYSV